MNRPSYMFVASIQDTSLFLKIKLWPIVNYSRETVDPKSHILHAALQQARMCLLLDYANQPLQALLLWQQNR